MRLKYAHYAYNGRFPKMYLQRVTKVFLAVLSLKIYWLRLFALQCIAAEKFNVRNILEILRFYSRLIKLSKVI